MNTSFTRTATSSVYGRTWYSSEILPKDYSVASLSSAPGAKWAEKKFSTGIHASVKNEQFCKMLEENIDRRPFAGAPFDTKNTVATTGAVTPSTLIQFAEPEPAPEQPVQRVVRPLTMARLRASR